MTQRRFTYERQIPCERARCHLNENRGQTGCSPKTGEFHFLTFSCYRRRPYLKSVAAMELFEDALERVRCRSLFVAAGYVVMPEHVHLLVNEAGGAPFFGR